jgi:large subunit ribosomal protein L31e
MTELKREYVVPLRRKTKLAPRWRRSKKAVSVLKDFIKKHMKTDNVIICNELNEHLWKDGAKNPPGKVSVIALKSEIAGEEKTLVNLLSVGIDSQRELYKKETPKAMTENLEKEIANESKKVKDADFKEAKSEEEVKDKKEADKK